MNTIPIVEGMREVKQHAQAMSGQLALPQTADKKKYAFKWAKEGLEVEGAQQPQTIRGDKIVQVDGWVVWKDKGQMCRRVLGSGRYVLLCRPRGLQDAVNAQCGNVSRERIIKEHSGTQRAAPEGEATPGSGMLPSGVLEKLDPTPQDAEKLRLHFNQIKPATGTGSKSKK
jgi:hypothetical protein